VKTTHPESHRTTPTKHSEELKNRVRELEAEVTRLRERVAEWQRFNSAMIWNNDDAGYDEESYDET